MRIIGKNSANYDQTYLINHSQHQFINYTLLQQIIPFEVFRRTAKLYHYPDRSL